MQRLNLSAGVPTGERRERCPNGMPTPRVEKIRAARDGGGKKEMNALPVLLLLELLLLEQHLGDKIPFSHD